MVSEDGLYITYRATTLSISKWRSDLLNLLKQATSELQEILLGDDYGLKIPDYAPDDWDSMDVNHCWMDNSKFLPPDTLLRAYLNKGTIAGILEGSKFFFKVPAVWELLRKINTFQKRLFLLGYFLPGGVPHVSEFRDHKIRNDHRG